MITLPPIKPDPDFEGRLLKVLLRRGEPDRVPFIELGADREILEAVFDEPLPWANVKSKDAREKILRHLIRFWYTLGYDAFWFGPRIRLPKPILEGEDTALLSRGQRQWVNETVGLITGWEDFERYSWPKPEEADYRDLEFVVRELPEGMAILGQVLGPLETVMQLMGYQTFALALYDNPDLVAAMFARVAAFLVPIADATASIDQVGALWMGDDMAFRTSTMISVKHLQQYVFPIQKQIAAVAHAHDKPFLLHTCGNRQAIMDLLIDDVGVDAIHSFEDTIQPVSEAKARYGDRVALLGGVDMDFLCRADEDSLRAYVRQVIAKCAPGGGYAFGTGNTVANFIPVQNYLIMLDEAWRCAKYPIGL